MRVWLMLLLVPAPVLADTVIVVPFGPHRSVAAAGHGETGVNWLDADGTDDTVCTLAFAAVELRHYLRAMTGRPEDFRIEDEDDLPDTDLILVGGPDSNAASRRLASLTGIEAKDTTDLGPEGYWIRSIAGDGRRITLLAGGGRVGTLYAAYDLLHRLGCRWFAPGEIHEVVPRIEGIPDLDVTVRPHYFTRGFHAWENRGNPDFLLWMARNRLNYWCLEQESHPFMRKLGIRMATGDHASQDRFLNPFKPYPYDHEAFDKDGGLPEDPYPSSGLYQGDADGNGKLSYFEAHPEWFPLVKDARVPGLRKGGFDIYEFGTNFCTSNTHAVEEFMKNHVQALVDGAYQGADVLRYWVLDNGKWCECDRCQALGPPTDRYLRLVHRLDREIKKARAAGRIHRPIIIRFLVYHDVLDPPASPLPEDFDYDTCSATFFPIRRSYVHDFDDPDCPVNSRYLRQLEGWVKDPERHYRGQICVGEYYNISGFKSLPMCFMHTMADDIPFYYRMGARHFHYMHVTTSHWGNLALTNYQMARQAFDVETDCEALWQDYFGKRYGPGAEKMRRFYESLERTFSNADELRYGLPQRLHRGSAELFPNAALRYSREPGVECDGPTFEEIVASARECRRLIDEVLAMELPGRVKARVLEDEERFTYGERTILYYGACVKAYLLGRAGRREEASRHLQEAGRLAELLQADTRSTQVSSSHANASNAFEATRATGALEKLEVLLGQGDGSF